MFGSVLAGWGAAVGTPDMKISEVPFKCAYHHCSWTNYTTLAIMS